MKGIDLLADIFLFIVLLMVTILMSALIWVFTVVYGVEASFGLVNPRTVTMTVLFKPINYESTFISFLECDYVAPSGRVIPMKKILNAVAIQNTTIIWLDGESIDAEATTTTLLNKMSDKPYLLKIVKPEIIIAEHNFQQLQQFQKTNTKLFLLNGNYVDLEFYVG